MKKKIEFNVSHWGQYKSNVEELGFKALVITGPIMGCKDVRFGRVVQVRKKSGAFGTDTVLVREPDGLKSYHNMGFFSVAPEYLPLYEEAMKEVDLEGRDKEGDAYNIQGKNEATGFVVYGMDDTGGKTYSFAVTTEKEGSNTKVTIGKTLVSEP
jgi:hypothetical protein